MHQAIPAHPRLADGLELVAGPGELLQLRGCRPPLRLTGRMPQLLLPLLDGSHSLEAITAKLNEWPPGDVQAAIRTLSERGLVSDDALSGDRVPPARDARTQAAFYWAAATGPSERGEETCQAVGNARLHLFGWGSLLRETQSLLGRCGAEALTVEAWQPPSGVLAATATAESAIPLVPFPTADQLKERIPRHSDLVLLALPRPSPAVLSAANAACLSQGIPFLPVVINGSEAAIGPTVLPGRSACYECFKQRLKANAAFPEDDAAYEAHLDRPGAGVTLPEWPPFTAAVGSLAAMEAIRLATRFTPPLTSGQVLFVDALTGSHRLSRVWKVPRCAACSQARRGEWGGGRHDQPGDAEP